MNKVTFTIGEKIIEFPVSSIKIDGNKFEVIVDTAKNPPVKESKPINDKIWMITLNTHSSASTTKDIVGYYTSEEKAQAALQEHAMEAIKTDHHVVKWANNNRIDVYPNNCNDVLVYRVDCERVL